MELDINEKASAIKEEAGVWKWLVLRASVGVEPYQISGGLRLGLSTLQDGKGEQKNQRQSSNKYVLANTEKNKNVITQNSVNGRSSVRTHGHDMK